MSLVTVHVFTAETGARIQTVEETAAEAVLNQVLDSLNQGGYTKARTTLKEGILKIFVFDPKNDRYGTVTSWHNDEYTIKGQES